MAPDEPDIEVEMDRAFEVPAEGKDIHSFFSLPINLPEDKWIRSIEVQPSARSVIHHPLFSPAPKKAGR